MPIEIKELHIKVTVNTPEGSGPQTPQPQRQPQGTTNADKDAIVAECVEQVLQILQEKRER